MRRSSVSQQTVSFRRQVGRRRVDHGVVSHRVLEERKDQVPPGIFRAPIDEGHLLQTFLDNTPDHVYFKDVDSRFTRISQSFARWVGLDDADAALGLTDFDFFADEHASAARAAELEVMRTGEPVVGLEEREVWPDGHFSWVSTTKVPLYDRDGNVVGIFGLSRDITARKQFEAREREQAEALAALAAELAQLTLHDELTGLYNRRGFEQLGGSTIERARAAGDEVCVLFTDLDGLKGINDGFGHAAGDRALVDVATTLRELVRATDVVGRIGGDEFAAVVVGLAPAEVEQLCERIRVATLALPRSQYPLSISIGVATFCVGSLEHLDELLVTADRAMYDGRHRRRRSHTR
jgi:diguanylate cyclase (GGDEF)-like protein/PAS domain S-box-containing protein